MNEVIETILSRRSIRSYQAKQVTDVELDTVIKAAEYAPSAMNQQSCHLAVIQNKELINELAILGKEAINQDRNPFYDAPTIILVFGKKDNIAPVQDACLAIENMFIAATALNLGTCWIHCVNAIFNTEKGKELQKRIGVGEEFTIVASCVLGYPATDLPNAPARKGNFVNVIK